jgi:hypothetical protein
MEEIINAHKILVAEREGRRSLGRSRRTWEDNIKMDLRDIGLKSLDWVRLAQNRDRWWSLVNTVMNLRFS